MKMKKIPKINIVVRFRKIHCSFRDILLHLKLAFTFKIVMEFGKSIKNSIQKSLNK